MGYWASAVIMCHSADVDVARGIDIGWRDEDDEDDQAESHEKTPLVEISDHKQAKGPRVFLTFTLFAGSAKGTRAEQIVERVAAAPWKYRESLLLTVEDDDDTRMAVWGFEGATNSYATHKEPGVWKCFVPAVPY